MADTTTNYRSALYTMFSLFFMWGFITCMNDILIPHFMEVFDLDFAEGLLVQFAFFGAYTIGSLIYFLFSLAGIDPIERIGYKNGILIGLAISAISCALFFPAAEFEIYSYFLGALFLLGIGLTILQIASNPYVAILGPSISASSRLNFAQGFNSFGTTIAPLIGGYLIFGSFSGDGELSAESVKTPYLIFSGLFVLLGIFIAFSKLPEIKKDEKIEAGLGALKYPFLILGGLAIFAYVGGEVAVGSTLISYLELPEVAGMEKNKADIFLAFYWGGAMIGRFVGAVSLGKKLTPILMLKMVGVALGFFMVVFLAAYLKSEGTLTLTEMLPFLIFVVLNLIGFVIGRSLPARTLGVFAGVNVLLLIIAINSTGPVAMWTIIGMGLFNSIMWSNIFTLAIEGLGKYTSQGSSVLVMMILGGALVPLIQGAVADITGDLQFSMIVPIFCYLYLVFYGLKGADIGKPQRTDS